MFCGHKLRTLQISVNIPNEVSTPFNAVLNIPIFLTFFQKRNAQQPAKSPPLSISIPKHLKTKALEPSWLCCVSSSWKSPANDHNQHPRVHPSKKCRDLPFGWAVQIFIYSTLSLLLGFEKLLEWLPFFLEDFFFGLGFTERCWNPPKLNTSLGYLHLWLVVGTVLLRSKWH